MAATDANHLFYKKLGELLFQIYEEDIGKDKKSDLGDIAESLCYSWSETEEVSESPIERILLAEILFATNGYQRIEWDEWYLDKPDFGVLLELQAPIGKYRVDFLLKQYCAGNTCQLVIECDGHDYHERTKEQAKRDKSRDREMTRNGIPILRFTGSEIWNDPAKCASEIEGMLFEQMNDLLRKAGIIKGKKK